MRTAPWLTLAAAAAAAHEGLQPSPPDAPVSRHLLRAVRPGRQHHGRAAAVARDAYSAVATRNNQCLDIKDNQLQSGAALQLWTCHAGANQKFGLAQGRLRGADNLCVDVPDGRGHNGARLQLWTCHDNNVNQLFEAIDGAYRWANSDLCLDVTDGLFVDGTLLQLWACDAANPNQKFIGAGAIPATTTTRTRSGTPAPSPTPTASGGGLANTNNFLGFAAIPFTAFVALHPQIAGFADAYLQAGTTTQIAPTLLGAVSLQESSGRCDAGNGGLFQFQNEDAWRAYGNGGDRYNCYDAAFGGARYLRALLDQNGNNLAQALRSYNGPVAWGGKPEYIDNIGAWMTGAFVYGPGT